KDGTGIVPIVGEKLGAPDVYGPDRMFVRVRLHGSYVEELRDADVRALKAANAPIVEIDLPEPSALGAEFVRWEIATAVAGALLRVNPFDEPNVQQAKDATRVLLDRYKTDGKLPAESPDRFTGSGMKLTLSTAARQALEARGPESILTLA